MTPLESFDVDVHSLCGPACATPRLSAELDTLRRINLRLKLAIVTAGHDLRQRLQVLMGVLELCARGTPAGGAGERLDEAKRQVKRLAGELAQLAIETEGLAVEAAPARSWFALDAVLDRIRGDWQSEAICKGLDLRIEPSHATVESDPCLLRVVLDNLLANAVRYTERGSVCVHTTIDGEWLIVCVRDTGPGIPDSCLERAFAARPLDRAPSSSGLGLGLSIARRTADLLGHPLDVETRSGEGTCFRIYLTGASGERSAGPCDRGSGPRLLR